MPFMQSRSEYLALSIGLGDLERQIERSARSEHAQLPVEDKSGSRTVSTVVRRLH
jgi:hypothetical protein